MASIGVLVIILGCAAIQYFKGSLTAALATLIAAVASTFAAMGYHEFLAGYLGRSMGAVAAWAELMCFLLTFILVFAVLQTALSQFLRPRIDLGEWPERIGRPVLGALLGWWVAGVILTAVSLAPLPLGVPYARFEDRNPDQDRPRRALLNADGFVCKAFGVVSRGSFRALRGGQSFEVVRAGFLDQLYLNRIGTASSVPRRTEDTALEVPRPAAVWEAPDGIADGDGRALPAKPGKVLMLARIGIKRSALKDASPFTLSQVRLICKPRDQAARPLAGTGRPVYPAGFMQGARQLALKGLDEQVTLGDRDFGRDGGGVRWIDFGFYVPSGFVPVLAQFKWNNMVEVPVPVTSDQAPEVIPLIPRQAPRPEQEAPAPPSDGNAPATPQPEGGLSPISQGVVGNPGAEEP